MIPVKLSISGFLSYRQRAELDFTAFDLACITGANGAGKSSLLDAITWALFGQARKKDDSIINTRCSSAEVTLIFAYEGNTYRVQRTLPRGKTTVLEFHIFQPAEENCDEPQQAPALIDIPFGKGRWKPLTERTLRETQQRIESTLRMDYETFVNASFFLQGKADQFTQQRPGDRKRILSSILGLEIWENYRQTAAERRRAAEVEIAALDGRLSEINTELTEEAARKARLKELTNELKRLATQRATQEAILGEVRNRIAQLEEQRKLVTTLKSHLDSLTAKVSEKDELLAALREEEAQYREMIAQADEIKAAYQTWQQARHELQEWDEIASRFRDGEKRRQEPLDEINAERARLEQERQSLLSQGEAVAAMSEEAKKLEVELSEAKAALQRAEEARALKEQLKGEREIALQRQAAIRAENPALKAEMETLKARIDRLSEVEGAECPLCGQPLSPEDRERLVQELHAQGKEMGKRYRQNLADQEQAEKLIAELTNKINQLAGADKDLLMASQSVARLSARLEQIGQEQRAWESIGMPRLAQIERQLAEGAYALAARARLAEIDAELKAIGYDALAHDQARRQEAESRAAEARLRALESAQAALAPLQRQIAGLESELRQLRAEAEAQSQVYNQHLQALSAAEAQAPDLAAVESALFTLKETENRLHMEVGAAKQKVAVLEELKNRRKEYEAQREELARLASQYRQLERAFGKDGVQALLIEQALPQIEIKANEILERLAGGNMSVRFVTQAAYKDRHRQDLRETLDIQISDGAGTRDYEMYSGGEAFRVDFAIRLALAEVLAQRAGARLQTLVIDEGFGSQDAEGRDRLVEAINLVKQDFAKILVITHIEELKDRFPARIEVEKTEQGSQIRLV